MGRPRRRGPVLHEPRQSLGERGELRLAFTERPSRRRGRSVTPGPSLSARGMALIVNGNYGQAPGATFDMTIAGTSSSGLVSYLAITGDAYFGGTLKIKIPSGFTPGLDDRYVLITYRQVRSFFGAINVSPLPDGDSFSMSYLPNALYLRERRSVGAPQVPCPCGRGDSRIGPVSPDSSEKPAERHNGRVATGSHPDIPARSDPERPAFGMCPRLRSSASPWSLRRSESWNLRGRGCPRPGTEHWARSRPRPRRCNA